VTSSPHYTAGVRPTILLVDDYADVLPAWEAFLHAEGFDVLTAATGRDALSRATSERPDLVILDLDLPDMPGCDVAQALRSHADTRHIPLIAATGYSHGSQLDRARVSGFDAIIVKPCDPVALVAEIRRLLPTDRSSIP
jgi:CheY-like chemotaxis protein